jgi:hypothetical protein
VDLHVIEVLLSLYASVDLLLQLITHLSVVGKRFSLLSFLLPQLVIKLLLSDLALL